MDWTQEVTGAYAEQCEKIQDLIQNKEKSLINDDVLDLLSEIRFGTIAALLRKLEMYENQRHVLISIGYLGDMQCYLDITLSEAKRRWCEDNPNSGPPMYVEVYEFKDEFHSYMIHRSGTPEMIQVKLTHEEIHSGF